MNAGLKRLSNHGLLLWVRVAVAAGRGPEVALVSKLTAVVATSICIGEVFVSPLLLLVVVMGTGAGSTVVSANTKSM